MLQYTPPTANMSEGANATAALAQLLMLQLLNQHRRPHAVQHGGQEHCWKQSLEEQCKMDVYLRQLMQMTTHHYDFMTLLPPCLRQLVIEDGLLNVLKSRYLDDAGIEAAKSGNVTELKILLDGGLSPNMRDADGATMLHHSAVGNHSAVVSLLLKAGADSNPVASGWNDQTPLNNAAYRGYLQIVKMLVKYKADLNAQTLSGNSPLHSSAFDGHYSTFRFLLMSGANPTLKNADGKTPREIATENGHLNIVKLLDSAGY